MPVGSVAASEDRLELATTVGRLTPPRQKMAHGAVRKAHAECIPDRPSSPSSLFAAEGVSQLCFFSTQVCRNAVHEMRTKLCPIEAVRSGCIQPLLTPTVTLK